MNYGITEILTLLGSLGLFLYGMKVMSDALMVVAGDKMRNILASMTSTRIYAVFTGFLITTVIQSSSATTLMVVSFANASLLTLTESIGVIMGANIGTTVTAWLITILGFKVSMSAIALPIVGLGFLMIFSKNKQRSQWGYFLVGFAILFIGLQFLKDAVPDLSKNPAALEFLSTYTGMGLPSVLLFLFIGTVLTIVIQSSSATMALTLVMCNEGWIPFDMAAAMVLGENIGTTITANLAAMVAGYNAKRTARAHLIFNVLGVSWMLILFIPFLNAIDLFVIKESGQSPFFIASSIPLALSIFHTTFNILNTLILLSFVPLIAKMVTWMVPETTDPEKAIDQPMYLNQTDLKYPQTGIMSLIKESTRLFEKSVYRAIAHGLNVHRSDIASNKSVKEITRHQQVLEINFDELYYGKIKSIYSQIVEYATLLQSRFELSKKKIELIRNVLIANRHLVSIVKDMKALHINMTKYLGSDNDQIKAEYNSMRKILIKVLRELLKLKSSESPEKNLRKLRKLKSKADKSDVLFDGSITKLVRKNLITNQMATSLMNDSATVNRMVQGLIKFGELLYLQRDMLIDEENINGFGVEEEFGILTPDES